jgi:hypothetical protein
MNLLDWRHVYGQVFPTIPAGAFLGRLRTEPASVVLVTGCQRSGTTWFTKLLGSCLQDAHAPKELDVCNYLINNLDFPLAGCSTLVLQTTFLNTETESYATLRDEIRVVVIARNPFSVCWSMVNNWDNLSLEYARRCRTSFDAERVHAEEELWRMAVHLYRESAESTLAILRDRPSRTRLLIYDELIHDPSAALDGISAFLGREVTTVPPSLRADLAPASKHQSMPGHYRELVARECNPIFARLMRCQARSNPE